MNVGKVFSGLTTADNNFFKTKCPRRKQGNPLMPCVYNLLWVVLVLLAEGCKSEQRIPHLLEEYRYDVTNRVTKSSGNDHTNDVRIAFRKLRQEWLPWMLPLEQIYVRAHQGIRIYAADRSPDPLIRVYGPSPRLGHINYLSRWERDVSGTNVRLFTYRETFAHAVRETMSRKDLVEYEVGSGFERGHGVDLIDTIPQCSNSNNDPDNYIPQISPYNSKLRRVLVGRIRKARGQYREISLYDESTYYSIPPTPPYFLWDGIVC
ncbi:MAG: hypothetical protein AAFY41_19200, partial [Bacteroidota bacterium]